MNKELLRCVRLFLWATVVDVQTILYAAYKQVLLKVGRITVCCCSRGFISSSSTGLWEHGTHPHTVGDEEVTASLNKVYVPS